jgi:small-conductance mechanosensitive channel
MIGGDVLVVETVLEYTLWDNRLADYLKVLGAAAGGVVVLRVLKFVVVKRVAAWARKAGVPVGDALVNNISRPLLPLLYLGTVYLALGWLTIEAGAARVVEIVAKVLLTFLGGRFVIAVLINAIKYYWVNAAEDGARERTFKALSPIIKIAVWAGAVVFLLDNLGFKVTTVVAGLGIGGVAVALAGQAILKDLFSYFAILFDRPFEIGDFIAVGDKMGTVERVGLKTTRLTSLSGEQLIFSNADLTDSPVQNYKRMERRRVAFRLRVSHQTSAEKLEAIPGIIKGIVDGVDGVVFDRAHFASYGEYSLDYEIVFYVLTNDYGVYMDIQQRINLAIFREFGKRGIEFAFPRQTVRLAGPEKRGVGGRPDRSRAEGRRGGGTGRMK